MAVAQNKEARRKAFSDSYAQTTAWLIEQHRQEFNMHRQTLLAVAGIEWSPPLTDEQKDEQALIELLARRPELIDKMVAEIAPDGR